MNRKNLKSYTKTEERLHTITLVPTRRRGMRENCSPLYLGHRKYSMSLIT